MCIRDSSYTIRPVCGFTQNAVMDLYGASTADGSNINIFSYNASNAQRFFVEKPVTVLKGDLNGDGVINLRDAIMSQRAAFKLIELNANAKTAADINADGKLTMFDAIAVQKLSLNL